MNWLSSLPSVSLRRQQVLSDTTQSALALARQSPPIARGQALADAVYSLLKPLQSLYSDKAHAEAVLRVMSTVLATHLEVHLSVVRRTQVQRDKVQSQLNKLTAENDKFIALKRERDEIRAKVRPALQAARIAYARMMLFMLLLVLTLLGEAGLVYIVWADVLGTDSPFTTLSAASIALAFVLVNEFLVGVGLAPLYAKLYAMLFPASSFATAYRQQTQSPTGIPFPTIRIGSRHISNSSLTLILMTAMTLVQVLFIVSVTLLRKEYVAENSEGVYLFNSTVSILMLSFFSHKLMEAVKVRYPVARDLRAQLPFQHELAEVTVALKDIKRHLRAAKPLKRRLARLDSRFLRAANAAYRSACRNKKIVRTALLMNFQLSEPKSPQNVPSCPLTSQPLVVTSAGKQFSPSRAASIASFVLCPLGKAKPSPTTGSNEGTLPHLFSMIGEKPMKTGFRRPASKGTSTLIVCLCAFLLSGYGCRRASQVPIINFVYRDTTTTEQQSALIVPADTQAVRMVMEQLSESAKEGRNSRVEIYTTPQAGHTVGDSRHHLEGAIKRLTPREQKRQLEDHNTRLNSLFYSIEHETPVQGESAILAPVAALMRRMSEQPNASNTERQLTVISDLEEYSPGVLTASQITETDPIKFQRLLETIKRKYPAVANPPQKIVFIVVPNTLRRTEAYQNRLREFWQKVATQWGVAAVEFISPPSQTVHASRRTEEPSTDATAPGFQEQPQASRQPVLVLNNRTTCALVLQATDIQSQVHYQFTFPAKTEKKQPLPIGKFVWTLTSEKIEDSNHGRCQFKPYRRYYTSISLGNSNSSPVTLGDPE